MIKLPKSHKYPKKIFVKNESYRIVFTRKLDADTFGETDPERRVIRLRAGMSDRETFKTFIHELLHVLHFEGNFKLKHKQVYALEDAIAELLMDNFLTPGKDDK